MTINYEALKAELDTGYDANDQLAADALNAPIQVIRASMSGSEMWDNTAPADFAAITDPDLKSQWLSFCAIAEHNPENNGLAHKFIEYIFGATSATETALGAARTTLTTRAKQLGMPKLSTGHISTARLLP